MRPCARRPWRGLGDPETLAIMECRYGPQTGHAVAYGEVIKLGEVESASCRPAMCSAPRRS
jgi:hypothetical protein